VEGNIFSGTKRLGGHKVLRRMAHGLEKEKKNRRMEKIAV
jgi:hypothetical protein